jgi:3'(2'), 5'-bisphosphate nucleotidase
LHVDLFQTLVFPRLSKIIILLQTFSGLYHHSTVLIGVSCAGRPVAGIIHEPFYGYKEGTKISESMSLGRTIWGVPGIGAFGFQRKNPPEGRRIITTTRSHSNKSVVEAIEAMKPDGILRVGGSGKSIHRGY